MVDSAAPLQDNFRQPEKDPQPGHIWGTILAGATAWYRPEGAGSMTVFSEQGMAKTIGEISYVLENTFDAFPERDSGSTHSGESRQEI
jgi:hypothetical protein